MRDSIKDLSAFTFHNSAEATEITTITNNSIQRGHTVSVISVEESTVCGRLGAVIMGIFVLIIVVIMMGFILSGGWLIILIVWLVWEAGKFIIYGHH